MPGEHVEAENEVYETIPNELNQHEIPDEMEEMLAVQQADADSACDQPDPASLCPPPNVHAAAADDSEEEADYPIIIQEMPDDSQFANVPM